MHENHQAINSNKVASKVEINVARNMLIALATSMLIDLSNLIIVVGCLLCFGSINIGLTAIVIVKCCLDLTEFSNNIFNYLNNEKLVRLKNITKITQSNIYISQTNSILNFFKPDNKTSSILKDDSDKIKVQLNIT